jgi:hypothetical protein
LIIELVLFNVPLEYDLDCNRPRGLCTLTQQFLTRSRAEQAQIKSIQRAAVQVRNGGWGRSRARVRLDSLGKSGWVVADYGSSVEAADAARRINAFLGDPNAGHIVLTKNVNTIYWATWLQVPIAAAFLVALMAVLVRNRNPGKDR